MQLSNREVEHASLSTLRQEKERMTGRIAESNEYIARLQESLKDEYNYYSLVCKSIFIKERAQEAEVIRAPILLQMNSVVW